VTFYWLLAVEYDGDVFCRCTDAPEPVVVFEGSVQ
jgi:hypothetical protein